MSAEHDRWFRLDADLIAAGVEMRMDERPYSESYRGRVQHGISRSAFLRTATGNVSIADRWWRKNADVWVGWEVYTEDREGITTRTWPVTKNRAEVVAAVRAAVA